MINNVQNFDLLRQDIKKLNTQYKDFANTNIKTIHESFRMAKNKNKANRIVENYKKEVNNSIDKFTKQNNEMIAYLKKFDKALLDEQFYNENVLIKNKEIVRQVMKLKSITKKELETIGARMDKATLITITLFALNNELAKQKSFEVVPSSET